MNKLARAVAIAALAFEGKVDKGGKPYILHCLRVMNAVDQKDEELMQIAILHDVVEDTNCTLQDLVKEGFSPRVVEAIGYLTHKGGDYFSYIEKIPNNIDALKVKIADINDNANITRIQNLTSKDLTRLEKYHRAYLHLNKYV